VVKKFYTKSFGWVFTDFGLTYTAFAGECVEGGFAVGEVVCGSTLVILYSASLEETRSKVLKAGGEITKDIFSFPGGRRFQFKDPAENELAVWSEEG
jgi:hypothetical protein